MESIERDDKTRRALEILTIERFEAFVRAAEAQGNVIAARQMGGQLDAGKSVESLFFPDPDSPQLGSYGLDVEVITENHFQVDLGFGAGLVGDGGSWIITFGPDGDVASLEGGRTWIA